MPEEYKFDASSGKCIPQSEVTKHRHDGKTTENVVFSLSACKAVNEYFKKNPSAKNCTDYEVNRSLADLLGDQKIEADRYSGFVEARLQLERCAENGLNPYIDQGKPPVTFQPESATK